MMHVLNAQRLIQLPISAVPSLANEIYKLFSFENPSVKVLKIINAGRCVSYNLKLLITFKSRKGSGFCFTNI